ncbi:MAG: GNAT family N-acetyltransferase [Chloroflexota bacterium]
MNSNYSIGKKDISKEAYMITAHINVHIRELQEKDLGKLAQFFRSSYGRTFADDLNDQIQGKTSFFVAWLEDNPIGHMVIYWAGARDPDFATVYPNHPEVIRGRVLEAYRSMGVGGQLAQACFREAKARGFSFVSLAINHNNPRSLALFLRLGCIKTEFDNSVERYQKQLDTGETIWVEEAGVWLIKEL